MTVLAFASLREAIGSDRVAMTVNGGSSAGELLSRVCAQYPAVAAYRKSLRIAVNGEYVDASASVAPGDEVALLPPVAGG